MTAAPHAHHAIAAGDADRLGGQSPGFYLGWANLNGVPAGLDDGDNDTLGGLTCAADEIAKWTGSAWSCAATSGVSYSRRYLVGPVGTLTENGAALLAAMAAIPPRTGSADIALLKLEPGWYDLGGEQLVIQPYVDVEGSGHSNYQTLIRSERCRDDVGDPEAAAAIVGGQFTELRDVIVQNTCADDTKYAAAYYNEGFRAKLKRVHAYIDNSLTFEPHYSWAIYNAGANFELVDVEAFGNGGGAGFAIYNTADHLVLRRVERRAGHPAGSSPKGSGYSETTLSSLMWRWKPTGGWVPPGFLAVARALHSATSPWSHRVLWVMLESPLRTPADRSSSQ